MERWDWVMWTGLVWLRIGTGGELLWIRYWTFWFHEMLGNLRVASRVVLSPIELVVRERERRRLDLQNVRVFFFFSISKLLVTIGFCRTNFRYVRLSRLHEPCELPDNLAISRNR
jgi:hypothetical protein